jgi:hypothetical protein
MARREKTFKIPDEEIRPLATKHGASIASDRITVDGTKVGFMYREPPDFDTDSGWRFMAGDESQEYMDDADNHAVYDVNTIANYDPDIIPLLKSPFGSAFERIGGTGPFIEVELELPED